MTEFIQQLLNGLSLGSIYALIALGYTMVYGILQLINFAHGEIYMLGAFTAYYLVFYFKLNFILALVLSMIITAGIGVVIEKLAYKPLRNSSRVSALLTALGVSMLLQNLGLKIFGGDPKAFPQLIPNKPIFIGDLIIFNQQIVIVVVAIILMVILEIIVHYTKIGKAMRAVAFDKDAAKLMGIDSNMVISFTFAIGSALAAAAGVLIGMRFNRIDPLMGMMPGIKAFVAAVLGGIGSIPGAVLGGLIMGISESLVVGYLSSTYRDAIAFALLIIILIIKPAGLLGKNIKEKV
ncbi:branched-chain amino acid ABC transporter permease [Haliovirga abyssi]|uniref:Branched-chain amino acid ABC transporter permease n=1 Tax=Haliovirga abyssi TaxID=2996794 RepID=A0AAU9DDT1_9FUSO|nr:branched-chain amino acid ABC transporter permease [Haliovirga abyssi]BDU49462.1 branched-chain amino acid ABC transporter permease [Haliovirga abyssi]